MKLEKDYVIYSSFLYLPENACHLSHDNRATFCTIQITRLQPAQSSDRLPTFELTLNIFYYFTHISSHKIFTSEAWGRKLVCFSPHGQQLNFWRRKWSRCIYCKLVTIYEIHNELIILFVCWYVMFVHCNYGCFLFLVTLATGWTSKSPLAHCSGWAARLSPSA